MLARTPAQAEWNFFLRGSSLLTGDLSARGEKPPGTRPKWLTELQWSNLISLWRSVPTMEELAGAIMMDVESFAPLIRSGKAYAGAGAFDAPLPAEWAFKV